MSRDIAIAMKALSSFCVQLDARAQQKKKKRKKKERGDDREVREDETDRLVEFVHFS